MSLSYREALRIKILVDGLSIPYPYVVLNHRTFFFLDGKAIKNVSGRNETKILWEEIPVAQKFDKDKPGGSIIQDSIPFLLAFYTFPSHYTERRHVILLFGTFDYPLSSSSCVCVKDCLAVTGPYMCLQSLVPWPRERLNRGPSEIHGGPYLYGVKLLTTRLRYHYWYGICSMLMTGSLSLTI